ncbi:MAG TPA: hypothetical protein VF698_04210 [Thermoanaerobaculia bacterium]|jgi:hypothetical protein
MTPVPGSTSELMEDVRFGTEITAASGISQIVNGAGQSELFYSGTGEGGATLIYNVQPDAGSDTGWRYNTLTPDAAPSSLNLFAGGDNEGLFTFLYAGANASTPDIRFTTRGIDGWNSEWYAVDASSVVSQSGGAIYVVGLAAASVDGMLTVAAVLSEPGTGAYTLWLVDWKGTAGGWTNLGTVDQAALFFCTTLAAGTGVLGLAATTVSNSYGTDLILFLPNGQTSTIASNQNVALVAVALQEPLASGKRYSGIFIYNDGSSGGSQSVSFIDCGVAAPVPLLVDTTLACAQIVAVDAGVNPIFLATLDEGLNVLYKADATPWTPVDLGVSLSSPPTGTSLTGGLDAGGAPLLFGIDATSNVLFSLLQQSDATADGTWVTRELEAQRTTTETFQVYGTTFTLADAGGNLLVSQTLQVTSPVTTTLLWQRQTLAVGPGVQADVVTNARGEVTLYAPTGTLNASKLVFSGGGIPVHGPFVVDPDDPVRARLANLTEAQVGTIVGPRYAGDVANIYQAIHTTMSYQPVTPTQRIAGYRRAIDPASGKAHWNFRVGDGRAAFVELTAADAAARREQLRDGTAKEFSAYLGDIVEEGEQRVISYFEVVVTAAKDPKQALESTVHWIVDGVKYYYDGAIDSIEHAFALVESIWAGTGVSFQQLFENFAWQLSQELTAIWNTKAYFEQLLDNSWSELSALLAAGRAGADGFFTSVKQDLDAQFDAARAALGTQTYASLSGGVGAALGAVASSGSVATTVRNASVRSNWLFEKIWSPIGQPSFAGALTPGVTAAFNTFQSTLSTQLSADVQQQIATIQSYLANAVTSPEAFEKDALAILLTAAQAAVVAVLDVIDAVVLAFFDLAEAFVVAAQTSIFQQPIGGFFVQAIYDALNPTGVPETVNLTGFVSLVCAFPTTILYQLIEGAPPFPAVSSRGVGAPDPFISVLTGLALCGWGVIDAVLDLPAPAVPAQRPSLALMLGASYPFLLQALSLANMNGRLTFHTTLTAAQSSFWCAHWGHVLYASGYKAATRFRQGPRAERVWCGILAALGVLPLGFGIWALVEEVNAHSVTAAGIVTRVFGPLPVIAKPLRFGSGTALVALGAIDLVGDFGVGIVQMIPAANEAPA